MDIDEIWNKRSTRYPTFCDPRKFDIDQLINMIVYLKRIGDGYGFHEGTAWYLDLCEMELKARRKSTAPEFEPSVEMRVS